MLRKLFERHWQTTTWLSYLLFPLSLIFRIIVQLRRCGYRIGLFKSVQLTVPVIVIGNMSVGGNGKTPMVIALTKWLRHQGLRVGIISRGYGAECQQYPHSVQLTDQWQTVGDEPYLLAKATGVPVVIDPNRVRAASFLLANNPIDIILSDDGLQHYRLHRDIEIIMHNTWENTFLFPAGPFREPMAWLKQKQFIVSDQANPMATFVCQRQFGCLTNHQTTVQLEQFSGQIVYAISAIAKPERFFNVLEASGLKLKKTVFPDHYPLSLADLPKQTTQPIIMTEKDYIKIAKHATNQHWYLPMQYELSTAFKTQIMNTLNQVTKHA